MKENKELLLRYLSMALPYGVCVHIRYKEGEPCYGKLTPRDIQWFIDSNIEVIKPYLRPMSSMTEEEINEFILISDTTLWLGNKRSTCILSIEQMNWLNTHHFDYLGLIPKGLAIAVTEENNPYNIKEE